MRHHSGSAPGHRRLARGTAPSHRRRPVGLRLIDSSGVGAVVFLYKKAKEYGGVVTVLGLRDQPLSIFKLLRLDRFCWRECAWLGGGRASGVASQSPRDCASCVGPAAPASDSGCSAPGGGSAVCPATAQAAGVCRTGRAAAARECPVVDRTRISRAGSAQLG